MFLRKPYPKVAGWAGIVGVAVLSACATKRAQITYSPPPDVEYEASMDEVWAAVIEVFTDLEIPIENMEKVSGFIRSDDMEASAREGYFLDCGTIYVGEYGTQGDKPAETSAELSLIRVTVLVQDEGRGITSVRVRELAKGGTYRGDTYDCVSTGRYGELFIAALNDRLNS